MKKPIKQLNIFNEIDHMDDEGKIMRCEICGKPMDHPANCCSESCSQKWVEKYLNPDAMDQKKD